MRGIALLVIAFILALISAREAVGRSNGTCIAVPSSGYDYALELAPGYKFAWRVDNASLHASVELLNGTAWVGWAVSSGYESPGADAIVGVARGRYAGVASFDIAPGTPGNITRRPQSEDPVFRAALVQHSGKTFMAFSRPLLASSPRGTSILPAGTGGGGTGNGTANGGGGGGVVGANGGNAAAAPPYVVLYAWGNNKNAFGNHGPVNRGAFSLNLLRPWCAVAAPSPAPVRPPPFLGLPSSDADYDWYVTVGGGTLSWRIMEEEGLLSVKIEQPALAWVAFAVAADASGTSCVGSDAVIGLPPSVEAGAEAAATAAGEPAGRALVADGDDGDDGGSGSASGSISDSASGEPNCGVFSYILYGETVEQAFPRTSSSLRNTSILQQLGSTVIHFIRPFNDTTGQGLDIDRHGLNTFLWAVGTTNELGPHGTEQRGAISIDFGTVPSAAPVPAPPTASPGVPAVSGQCAASEPGSGYAYAQSIGSNGECTMRWRRGGYIESGSSSDNSSSGATGGGDGAELSVWLSCTGAEWLGWAVSDTSAMAGSDAVIGAASGANPGVLQYDISGRSVAGVQVRALQSLTDTDFALHPGANATMRFTRPVTDATGSGIDVDGASWVLVAWGKTTMDDGAGGPVAHGTAGRVQLQMNLETCSSGLGDAMPSFAFAHAWLMLTAWGLVVPLAGLAARFGYRNACGVGLHVTLQTSAYTIAIGGLALAVRFVSDAGATGSGALSGRHFSTAHGRQGLALTCLGASQIVLALARPQAPKKRWENLSKMRWFWLYVHRTLAATILGLTLATIVSGLAALESLGQLSTASRRTLTAAYLGVFISMVALAAALELAQRRRRMRPPKEYREPTTDERHPQMSSFD